jgi:hypothetical protein
LIFSLFSLIFSTYFAHFSLTAAFFLDKALSIIGNECSSVSEDTCGGRIALSRTGADGPSAAAQLAEKCKPPNIVLPGEIASSSIVRLTARIACQSEGFELLTSK